MAGELVFITGSSGHLGFRVLALALKSKYRVRASVRSEASADKIKRAPSVRPYLDKLEFVVISDILTEGVFDDVLNGVTYVLHIASPLPMPTDNYERDLVQPAVQGTLSILKSASKISSIKRVVITSSVVAIVPWYNFTKEQTDKIFNERSTVPPPKGPYQEPFEAYAASKALALQASIEFMKSSKPKFDLINVMPSFILGKNELITDPKDITNGTNVMALGAALGNKSLDTTAGNSVYLEDVAIIHVLALNPNIKGNQNFICTSEGLTGGTTWEDAISIIKKRFPEEVKNGTFPLGGSQPTMSLKFDTSLTEKTFGMRFKNFEPQVISVAQHYIDLSSVNPHPPHIHQDVTPYLCTT